MDSEPAAAVVTTDTMSSTQTGVAAGAGLVAKRMGALECGARVETRHSDHAARFGTSTKVRMQMPEDCVPQRSANVATKVLRDAD